MILSLDASTHSTGWALFDGEELIDYGCITAQKANVFENIFVMIRAIDGIFKKYPAISQVYMEEVLPKNEDYDDGGTHHSNPKVFKPLMWLQAAINFLIYIKYKNVKVEFIFPNSWRSKIGIATGRGITRDQLKAADKKFAKDTFGISVNDDIADALGLGWSQIKPSKEPPQPQFRSFGM